MTSKILAIEITQKAGIETWIVNSLKGEFLKNAIQSTIDFTKI